jgi:hypothetical protein
MVNISNQKIFGIFNLVLFQINPLKELGDFKVRRNNMFKKSLTDFVEIQLKHANVSFDLF